MFGAWHGRARRTTMMQRLAKLAVSEMPPKGCSKGIPEHLILGDRAKEASIDDKEGGVDAYVGPETSRKMRMR